MKLGRNEKCWCGSGLKFKRCHLNRDEQEAISKSEAIKASNKINSRECCMIPSELSHECTNKIINAHTVSKSGSLAAIADNTNHVMGLKISLPNLLKGRGKLRPEPVGINQASTFKGFCSYHDNSLFSCVEDQEFVCSEEQCFALAYRSVAKEMYAKQNSTEVNDFLRDADKGKGSFNQFTIQQFVTLNGLGAAAAVKDLSMLKGELDKQLIGGKSSELCHLVFQSDTPPPVMVSSILAPTIDFNGNTIQDLGDLSVVPDQVCFNSFASDGKGYVVFSWLKSAEISTDFINTLLAVEPSKQFHALVRFFFGYAENTFFSKNWWQGLSKIAQSKVQSLIMSGASPFEAYSTDKLVDDGTDFGFWEITNIQRLNF
ncbi:YecA family protein [Motilimonas cestriensis]|uniref:YecA family protein n=1 Tax=Motilimonas cestriensis TaxID=2742685 RepID=UPI003DA5480C